MKLRKALLLAAGALAATPALAAKPIACADLKTKLSIADTTITLTEMLPAGANPNPVGTITAPICRVVGVTTPAVRFEVWMPSEGWNGKFQMVGNGADPKLMASWHCGGSLKTKETVCMDLVTQFQKEGSNALDTDGLANPAACKANSNVPVR